MPALTKLLARGHALTQPAASSDTLCQAMGIAHQQDWPVAAFTARAAGLDVAELQLDSPEFVRLRLGIGRPSPSADATSYVLKKPPAAERELLDAAIHAGLAHIDDIVHGRYQKVMNLLHSHSS